MSVEQADHLTKQPQVETMDVDQELVSLCLGYVPKDLAYNLALVLDTPHIFEIHTVAYKQPKNTLTVKFGLAE